MNGNGSANASGSANANDSGVCGRGHSKPGVAGNVPATAAVVASGIGSDVVAGVVE